MDEIEYNLLQALSAALDVDGVPIVMIAYDGPPPNPDFYLDLLRMMITETGSATGCITFGTANGTSGMFPLMEIDPQTGLTLLIAMRKQNLIGSVSWVTVASDTYRRPYPLDTDPDDVQKGDMELMRMLGDDTVEDVLMAVCVAPDGPGFDRLQRYRKTEAGIEWDEVEDQLTGGTHSGPMIDLMQELVTA